MFGGTPPGTRTRNLRINSPKISVRGVHTPGLSASRRVSASVQSIVCGLVRWVCVPLCQSNQFRTSRVTVESCRHGFPMPKPVRSVHAFFLGLSAALRTLPPASRIPIFDPIDSWLAANRSPRLISTHRNPSIFLALENASFMKATPSATTIDPRSKIRSASPVSSADAPRWSTAACTRPSRSCCAISSALGWSAQPRPPGRRSQRPSRLPAPPLRHRSLPPWQACSTCCAHARPFRPY